MSVPYRAVVYTSQKLFNDAVMVASMVVYLLLFVAVSLSSGPRPDLIEAVAALTGATGTLTVVMLHVILVIGPLARLHPAFGPFIQIRRHMGVATFMAACAYALLKLLANYTGGAMNPVAAALIGNGQVFRLSTFPFEIFGFAALLILAAMAFTSHDFWIVYLGLDRWKKLHMLIYAAYLLILLYAGLGPLQSASNPVSAMLLAAGLCVVTLLHWKAAQKEHQRDLDIPPADAEGWLLVGAPTDIPQNRALIVSTGTERVAVFRHWKGISAISNVCAHQGGPIGEGEVVAGFARCPWHGTLYSPTNGTSPPPIAKRVPTYNLKLVDGMVYLNPNPNAPGTLVDPIAPPERPRGGPRLGGEQEARRKSLAEQFFIERDLG